jgi:hypothetical protein
MYQGTRWVLLKQKKQSRKSHAWAPLIDTESRLIDMESPWKVRIKNIFGKLRLKFKLLKSLILSLIYALFIQKNVSLKCSGTFQGTVAPV